MSRFLRQSILVLILVTLALIAQAVYFSLYRDWSDTVRARARSANVLLDIASLESRFPTTLAFERIGAVIPIGRLPLPIALERGDVSLDVLPLFRLQGVFRYFVELYGGTLRGAGRKSLFGDELEILVSGNGLQLAKYPQMGATYVEGEVHFELDARAAKTAERRYRTDRADLRVTLRRGVYHGGLKIQGLIPIAAMDDVTMDLAAQQDGPTVRISQFHFHSSLGDVNGNGTFQTDEFLRPISGKATFSISLTPQGTTAYSGYLQLAANGQGAPTTSQWEGEVTIGGVGRPPSVHMKPIR